HGQIAERFCHRAKKFQARCLYPAACLRVRRVRRNFPERLEAAEMIDSQDAHALESRAESCDPPREAIALHPIPTIRRIAPALSFVTERIRGHAADRSRRTVRCEIEIIRPG